MSCQFFTNLFFLCLKGIKVSCFVHFLITYFYEFQYVWNEICFSPINLFYVFLIIRPTIEHRKEKGKSFPPLQYVSANYNIDKFYWSINHGTRQDGQLEQQGWEKHRFETYRINQIFIIHVTFFFIQSVWCIALYQASSRCLSYFPPILHLSPT